MDLEQKPLGMDKADSDGKQLGSEEQQVQNSEGVEDT
jgi:hypothetical protein